MEFEEGIYGNFKKPPELRADPFQSYRDGDQVTVGFITAIAPARGKRPREISPQKKKETKGTGNNLLLKIVDGTEPAIIISSDKEFLQDPFDESLIPIAEHREAKALSILNKFPIFTRRTDELPFGIMLVTFPSEEVSYPKESPNSLFSMFLSLRNALKGTTSSIKQNFNVINFFNVGPNSGASLRQLHSQTYIWKHKFSVIGKEAFAFLEAYRRNGCIACKLIRGQKVEDVFGNRVKIDELKIFEDEHVIVIFAFAPIRLLQTRVILKRHCSNMMELDDGELYSVAKGIAVADEAIFEVSSHIGYQFEDRSIALRECYSKDFHMIIDVLPAWPLAGAELVSSLTYASRPPEKAAEIFRSRTL